MNTVAHYFYHSYTRHIASCVFVILCLFTLLSPLRIYADNGTVPISNSSTGSQNSTSNSTFGGIVPCGNESDPNQAATSCNLAKFIQLIQNIITALFVISVPLATIAFVYVGWMLLTAQGDIGKRQEAKRIAVSVLTGFIIILVAWLVVYSITHALLNPSFNEFL